MAGITRSMTDVRLKKRSADAEINVMQCMGRKKRQKAFIAASLKTGIPQHCQSHCQRSHHATGQRQCKGYRQNQQLSDIHATNGAARNSHASQRSLKMYVSGQSKNTPRALLVRSSTPTAKPTQHACVKDPSISVLPCDTTTLSPAVQPSVSLRAVAHLQSHTCGATAGVTEPWRAAASFVVDREAGRCVATRRILNRVELKEALAVMRSPDLVVLGDSPLPASSCPTELSATVATTTTPASSVTPANSPMAVKIPPPRATGLIAEPCAADASAKHPKSPTGEAWRSYTGRYRATLCRWLLRAGRDLRLAPVTMHVAVRLLDIVIARMVLAEGKISCASSSHGTNTRMEHRTKPQMSREEHTDMTALILTDGARAAMASTNNQCDRSLSREQRRLLSITVLLLAGKLEEREIRLPTLSEFDHILSPNGGSGQDLQASRAKLRGASMQLLSLLEWRLEPLRTTAMHWLDFVLASGGLFVDDRLQQRGAQKLALVAAHDAAQALKRKCRNRDARRSDSDMYSDSGSDSDLDSGSVAVDENVVSPGDAADIAVDVHRPYATLSSLSIGAGAVLLRCFRRGAIVALDAAILNVKLGCKSEGCPPDEVLAAAALAAAREALGLADNWRRELEELTGVSHSMYADTFAQVKALCVGLEEHCYPPVPPTRHVCGGS